MPLYTPPQKFLVAFSLAGEQRNLVRPVAEAVQQELGTPNVFYDEWFEHYIAGPDADLKLQEIYGVRSVLAVVCVSERYGGKPWTRAEHTAIRARYMKAQETHDQLGIFPIRVGDGDVEGILFNAIVPDIRGRSANEAAELIIKRLRLIIPDLGREAPAGSKWPERTSSLLWPVADHTKARDAFEHLMSQDAKFRFLPVRGPTQVGKTHITKQMRDNALRVPELACGRFDFKGTADLDNEVSTFVQHLGIPVPSGEPKIAKQLGQILDALRTRTRPTLLVFDTYEQVGDAQNWVENTLLPSLIRAEWLRVVIVGQQVPERSTAMFGAISSPLIQLQPPSPNEWFDFGRQHNPRLKLDLVVQVHELCQGRASILAELFGPRG